MKHRGPCSYILCFIHNIRYHAPSIMYFCCCIVGSCSQLSHLPQVPISCTKHYVFFCCIVVSCSNFRHLPLVPHICVNELARHGFRQWFVLSHYLNQYWPLVSWTIQIEIQFYFHENTFEIVVCKMVAILSRGRGFNCAILGYFTLLR